MARRYNDPIPYNSPLSYWGADMANIFDGMSAQGMTALRGIHSEPATFYAGGTGNGVAISLLANEAPIIVIGDDQGTQQDRVISLQVLTSDVTAPKRGDTYNLTSIAHSGTWTHLKIAHRNNVRWTIEARLMTHGELAAAGVREVK